VTIAIVQPLLHRSIRRIWTGQVLAAIGTQLYSVALLWIAVGILGPDAGYLETLEAAAVLFGSLLGGALTDGWHPKVTLVASDLARGAVVLALPLGQALGGMSPALLVAVALSVGVMTGCFEPTLQAALMPLAPERSLRHATNGLFDATRRLARIAGPALVFLVHQTVSTIYFFVVTATTFAASAAAVAGSAIAARGPERRGGAIIGFRALRGRRLVIYALCSSAVANVAWAGGYLFGMALVFHHERAESLTGYSLMACAYGAGNVVSNVVLAGRPPVNAARWIIASKLIFGGGLVLLSCGLPLPWLMLVAAVTAVNGPLADLAVLHLMQSSLPASLLVHGFRAQTCIGWSGMLVGYLIAPQLLRWLPTSSMIALLGAITAGAGLAGLAFVSPSKPATTSAME
jgi:MFS transporter, DHA3 family, macrolide efflux protein